MFLEIQAFKGQDIWIINVSLIFFALGQLLDSEDFVLPFILSFIHDILLCLLCAILKLLGCTL